MYFEDNINAVFSAGWKRRERLERDMNLLSTFHTGHNRQCYGIKLKLGVVGLKKGWYHPLPCTFGENTAHALPYRNVWLVSTLKQPWNWHGNNHA